jgi:3-hexulose-6-phosphate synthase/6-phospho-3-hexuloisomerase
LLDLERALRIAAEAVPQGVDCVEAGTPLIKSEGLDAVRSLRAEFPGLPIVADMKPWGRWHANDMYNAGGVALVARELKKAGLLFR